MKKVLLATTALALSAGVASADVSVTGNARMGLQYNGALAANKTTLEKRMTVTITGTTETTSGITFGASMNLRANEGGASVDPDGAGPLGPVAIGGAWTSGARVYMQVSGFELAMGNINGAIESMPGVYSPSVGLTGLGWGGLVTNTAANGYFNWDAYSSSGNGAEGVEATYTAGAFTGHVSLSDTSVGSATNRGAAYGAYTFNDWTVALGVQRSAAAGEDKTVLTVGGNIGDYSVGFGFADNEGAKKFALNGSATFGATTVSAYVAKEDTAGVDTTMGLGVSYDLGGASLVGGIARTDAGNTRADLGVSFSF